MVERGGWSIYQDGVNTCEALQSMGLTARVCTFDGLTEFNCSLWIGERIREPI